MSLVLLENLVKVSAMDSETDQICAKVEHHFSAYVVKRLRICLWNL